METCFDLFGIECDKGWESIYLPIIKYIDEYNKTAKEPIEILQIKEKWAGLRIYTNYDTDELHEMIRNAENESYHTCEHCGTKEDVGLLVDGWYQTVCKKCAQELANSSRRTRRFKLNGEIISLNPE